MAKSKRGSNVAGKPGPKPKLEHTEQLIEQIRALGRIQATVDETASVLRVSLRTLQNFFAAHEDAKEAHETGKLEGLASLRRKQFAMADKNAAMAIWLGKQYLGQKDKSEVAVSHYDAMTDDQLRNTVAAALREARTLGLDLDLGSPAGLH